MAKNVSKRAYHKQDMEKLNRTALVFGGVIAVVILIIMLFSFIMK